MLTVIISIAIVAISIIAVVAEIKDAKYEGKCIEIFPTGLAIVSALAVSAFSILVENGCISFEAWQSIGMLFIIAVIAIVWSVIEFKVDISVTIYPWISTAINFIVFGAASIVAWVG